MQEMKNILKSAIIHATMMDFDVLRVAVSDMKMVKAVRSSAIAARSANADFQAANAHLDNEILEFVYA